MDLKKVISNEDLLIMNLLNPKMLILQDIEVNCDGTIKFPFDPDMVEKTYDCDLACDLQYADECNFVYDAIDGDLSLEVETFAVVHRYDVSFIINTMELIEYPDYHKYKSEYDNLIKQMVNQIKVKIRETIDMPIGEFVKDHIAKDTYFQARNDGEKYIYYIIYRWWNKVVEGKADFTDVVNGEGTVFIARND